MDILQRLLEAPNYTLSYKALLAEFGGLDLHFGCFCQRIANELGEKDLPPFALTDRSSAPDGTRALTLKSSVVAAMSD